MRAKLSLQNNQVVRLLVMQARLSTRLLRTPFWYTLMHSGEVTKLDEVLQDVRDDDISEELVKKFDADK